MACISVKTSASGVRGIWFKSQADRSHMLLMTHHRYNMEVWALMQSHREEQLGIAHSWLSKGYREYIFKWRFDFFAVSYLFI